MLVPQEGDRAHRSLSPDKRQLYWSAYTLENKQTNVLFNLSGDWVCNGTEGGYKLHSGFQNSLSLYLLSQRWYGSAQHWSKSPMVYCESAVNDAHRTWRFQSMEETRITLGQRLRLTTFCVWLCLTVTPFNRNFYLISKAQTCFWYRVKSDEELIVCFYSKNVTFVAFYFICFSSLHYHEKVAR